MRKTYFNILRRNQSWNINKEKNNENDRNENTKNYQGCYLQDRIRNQDIREELECGKMDERDAGEII